MTFIEVAAHVGLGHPLKNDLIDRDLRGRSRILDFAVRCLVAVAVVVGFAEKKIGVEAALVENDLLDFGSFESGVGLEDGCH